MAVTLFRMPSKRARVALAAALLIAAFAAAPSRAGGPDDQDRARRALQAGEVAPLQTILEKVGRAHPGEVMDVELDRDNGRWVYEIKVLQPGGKLLKLKVDGRDGTVLQTKEKAGSGRPARDPGRGGGR